MLFDRDATRAALETIVTAYERSAPQVAGWADDLYVRLGDADWEQTQLCEIMTVMRLTADGALLSPHLAANTVYKLLRALGRDVAGMASY